jgi:hypothetical protein
MIQPIGTIHIDGDGKLSSTMVSFPPNNLLVGNISNYSFEDVYTVCSCKNFIETSRTLNAIIARILSYQEKKQCDFQTALDFYLQSMDHFINVQRSKKFLQSQQDKVDRIYNSIK